MEEHETFTIMNNSITFIIEGKPIAKMRSRRDNSGKWYNPQSDEMHIKKKTIRYQLPEGFKTIGKSIPVIANAVFFFEPTQKERTKKFMELIQNEDVYYTRKPDRDNLDKFVLDLLSGMVFHDDNQVCDGRITKYYTPYNSRVEVEVIW